MRSKASTAICTAVVAADASLRQQRSGHIIEISPTGSRIPPLGLSGYHISKKAVEDFALELAHEVAPLGIKVTIVETGSTHNSRLEPSVPVVSQHYNESGIDPAQRAHPHDSQEGNDPGSESRLILSIAEMAEPLVRLVVGADATEHLTDTGQAVAGWEAKWRN